MLEPEDQGEVGSSVPLTTNLSPSPRFPSRRLQMSCPCPEEDGLSSCETPIHAGQWLLLPYPQLERELKDLGTHKAQENGAHRHRLQAITMYYDSLKERYVSSVGKTDSLLAKLEGVRVKRNSAQQEREAFWKEKDTLRIDRDETIQVNERFLKRLEDGSVKAESILAGSQTVENLRELIPGQMLDKSSLPNPLSRPWLKPYT
ncbi:hypothetical protein LIER_27284 [Lithospermum erythrorhizon]|uniref:Uncharacterized protein n=1 Tax=Lithospermum erythrorhizon TaxID=34254 RepID=A0AAV3RDH0_LITER